MFLTQVINSQITELSLCEDCAKKRGIFDPQSLTFAEKFFPEELKKRVDLILRELSARKAQPAALPSGDEDLLTRCPVCDFTLDDYRRSSRLGCPTCYSVFARELGKPIDAPDASDMPEGAEEELSKRAKLEKQLRKAIEREDYETAALLRDELKGLPE